MAGTHRDSSHTGPIALVGIGCRLPAEVDSPAALWRLLSTGGDAVRPIPRQRRRLLQDACAEQEPAPLGGYLSDVTGFDADFFGVSGREADVLDPQHRLLLEVVWEALEHAGVPPERLDGSPTGVFVGLSYHDYLDGLSGHPQELQGSILTNGHCVAAGRISYLLGLRGPCLALDTACSSSLVAVHLACQSLLSGECDLAVAGGVTVMLQARNTRAFQRMGMLSPTGRCHTFDAAADGFVRGEGCGAVVLKRLDSARRDGDRILAVIRGSAVNQDGRSDGLAAPSPAAQRAVLRQALGRAGVDPRDVGLIEAHGTGTAVGDPVEFAALAEVYGPGRGRCALGSVKTNLGHLEPAAGVTGLIKAALCLQHGQIPPNLHFTRWNSAIDPAGTRLFVPTRMVRWPVTGVPRRAAVSSFGFSGTNAHLLLEQAPASRSRARVPSPRRSPEAPGEVLLVSAGSRQALPRAAARLADWLEGDGAQADLRDVAHTLALRRSSGRGRLGLVAHSRADAVQALRAAAAGQAHPAVVSGEVGASVTRRPVWVFSGHGSQWPGMGRALLARDPAFAGALAEVDALIAEEAGFSVLDLVRAGRPAAGCGQVQPALFALQVALAAAWRAHGVQPAAVIGHSMGEIAAAVAAGALSLADGVTVVCRRSALLARLSSTGAMATVALPQEQVEADLAAQGADAVTVAVVAAPDSTVVAGDPGQIAALLAWWEGRGVPAAAVDVDVASHCAHVDPLLAELSQALSGLTPRTPQIPFYSTALEDPARTPAFDAAYWCANLRCPVRLSSAVAAAAADRHLVYLEVSPHPVVTRALRRTLAPLLPDPVVLPTLRRGEDEPDTFRTQLAALHCAGVEVDWSVLYAGGCLLDAPTTTFDRKDHWLDPAPAAARPAQEQPPAAGLGTRTELPGQPPRHCYLGDVGLAALPWLADHQVHGAAVMPGAGFYSLALTAACEVFDCPAQQVEVCDLSFHQVLPLAEHTPLGTTVTPTGPDSAECEMFSPGEDGAWVRHATALVRRLPAAPRPRRAGTASLARRHPTALEPAALYAALRGRGLRHGPSFTGLTSLSAARNGHSYWAAVSAPAPAGGAWAVHPVLVDVCLQLVVAGLIQDTGQQVVLPVHIRTVRVHGDPATAVWAHAMVTGSSAEHLTGQVRLLDSEGTQVMALDGVRFARRSAPGAALTDRWLLEVGWHAGRRPRPAPARPPGDWLVVGEGDGSAEELADALRAAGARTEVWEIPLGHRKSSGLRRTLAGQLSCGPKRAVVVLCSPAHERGQDPAEQALQRTLRLLQVAQAAAESADVPRLYTVTRGARKTSPAERVELAQASLRGLVRVLALEHPGLRATHLDLAAGPGGSLAGAAEELLADTPEDEVALRGADRLTARLAYAPPGTAPHACATTCTVRYDQDGVRLRAGRLGDLDALEPVTAPRPDPGPGEVEVRIRAAGLNFRDVLTAMGLLPAADGEDDVRCRIGFECSGVITRTGPGVEHLRAGDRVMAAAFHGGAFGSFLTLPAAAVLPVPACTDLIDAAGQPTAFLTAWYALRHLGRLAAGERVLIHSASGGTGLAAVAVARRLGATVLATAGSEDKRRYLRGLGIETVADSRSLDFTEHIRAATGGQGVDVVLNSLSGSAIRAGLETLRPFGRFLELGVRDILADAPLGLGPFRHNITMSTVDLIELHHERPEVFAAVFREVVDELAAGTLKPLHCTVFPLPEATRAFRLMAGAGHIGKLVLSVPEQGTTEAALTPAARPVCGDGAYIVTGGLRGLGLATAQWLAEQGAGLIVLNGRTAPEPAAAHALGKLVARGTRVRVVLGDIAAPQTADRLVAEAVRDGHRLRGVVHCAMVLHDAAVANISEEQLQRVWAPKATGAWRLHHAVREHRLDWFALYSSMASLLGNPGQGAYAAANSWLDGFAAWRSAQGLPTLAVNWGPWGEAGVATGFADRGYHTIPTAQGLQALGSLLARGCVQSGVIPGPPATWVLPAVRDTPFFSLVAPGPEQDSAAAAEPAGIRHRLQAAAPGPGRRTALEQYLADHIRAVLRLGTATVDPQTPLKALGFDSLLSMELRGRLETECGVRLAGDFVWRHPTISALADGLADRMGLTL